MYREYDYNMNMKMCTCEHFGHLVANMISTRPSKLLSAVWPQTYDLSLLKHSLSDRTQPIILTHWCSQLLHRFGTWFLRKMPNKKSHLLVLEYILSVLSMDVIDFPRHNTIQNLCNTLFTRWPKWDPQYIWKGVTFATSVGTLGRVTRRRIDIRIWAAHVLTSFHVVL